MHSFLTSGIVISFNSRSRVGSDVLAHLGEQAVLKFQFTLPCRERHF